MTGPRIPPGSCLVVGVPSLSSPDALVPSTSCNTATHISDLRMTAGRYL